MVEKKIRLVTINTWKGDGNYTNRLDLIAQQLQYLQPDIVCLQESLQAIDHSLDTASYLGGKLGLEIVYGPGRLKKRKIEGKVLRCYSGLGILSKKKPSAYKLFELPGCLDDPDRKALIIQLTTGMHELFIANIHLTHLRSKQALREHQLLSTLQFLKQFSHTHLKDNQAGHVPDPLFLCCGDMNFEIGKQDLSRLGDEVSFVLLDCYIEGGGKLPGYTFGLEERTPARIDYILHPVQPGNQPLRFTNARVVLEQKSSDGLAPSDHLGVMVDIVFPPKPAFHCK